LPEEDTTNATARGAGGLAPGVAYVRERPPDGVPVEAAPGIFWLRLPLPFALDHVNLWLIEDGPGWTLVDTGYGDAPTRERWDALLAGPLAARPITRILVTHFHPDHAGLAGWLAARTGAQLLMPRTEWLTARWLALDASDDFVAANVAHYRRAGVDGDLLERLRGRGNAYRRGVSLVPGSYRRIGHGDELAIGGSGWRVIVGEGHAPEQATLFCAERSLLIAADQLLPRITPVIGVWSTQPDADPLGEFDASLARYADLPEGTLVLPSHDRPYQGLHARRESLLRHHAERLERVRKLCREPASTFAIASALFRRPLDLHQTGFAIAETLAHLNRLLALGEVTRESAGEVGHWRAR
jgi:glyoxylase-like metal-dependent hydrolase (beta-lactamase superfamily II)